MAQHVVVSLVGSTLVVIHFGQFYPSSAGNIWVSGYVHHRLKRGHAGHKIFFHICLFPWVRLFKYGNQFKSNYINNKLFYFLPFQPKL